MIKEVKPTNTAEQNDDSSPPPSKGENNIPDEVEQQEKNFHNRFIDEDEIEEIEIDW